MTEFQPSTAENTPKKRSWLREIIVSIVILGLVFCVFHVVLGFAPVEGTSMQPLINENSDSSTAVLCRLQGAERGAIVIVPKPNTSRNLIKRVIAMPGDTVRVYPNPDNPTIAIMEINGVVQNESYLGEPMLWSKWTTSDELGFDTFVYQNYKVAVGAGYEIRFTVPANQFFALGDNRNNSRDGRHYGFFALDSVVGRVFLLIDQGGLRLI